VRAHLAQQLVGVGRLRDDVEAGLAQQRSRRPSRPEPLPTTAPPRPSSTSVTRSSRSSCSIVIAARVAALWRATFVSPSASVK
jgi:hypothetical protein